MCGIAGQLATTDGARIDREALAAMADALVHRGPDDEGLFVGQRAGLAFRRLSIIDIAGGHQPMSSADGRFHVVFNGEIYNHTSLRKELEALGARFRTRSDTEVLVHGARAWGERLPERLEGMFAFACYDELEGSLLLARDRMGKKPLFLLEHAGSLWFASEMGALQRIRGWDRAVDPAAVDIYLSQQFIPAPFSIHRHVRKLEPATCLRIGRDGRRSWRYWVPEFTPKRRANLEELAADLRERLRDAVRARLESEVPLGVFLSGGVDSSIVVGLMAEAGVSPLRTYTIGFEAEGYDERPYARAVAEHFGAEHHEYVVRPNLMADLPRILSHYGEPYADKSAVPTWYVAREAARDVTVVLNGDGADDILAGYGRYAASATGRIMSRFPARIRRAWEPRILDLLAAPASAPGRALGGFLRRAVFPESRSLVMPGFFGAREKQRLYTRGFAEELGAAGLAPLVREIHRENAALPELIDRMLACDLSQYLAGDLLPKVDISTMAHSIEARSPFLGRAVVDLALALPDSMRVRRGVGKYLLKKAFESFLPRGIAFREKQGFSVPIDRWLAADLAPLARTLLVDESRASERFFERREVERLYREHTSGTHKHGGRLWALVCFELWLRELGTSI